MRDYLASAFGAVVGGTPLYLVGTALGFRYLLVFMHGAELEGIVPPLVGGAMGAALGSGLGTWLVLRRRCCQATVVTGLVVGLSAPAFALVAVFLGGSAFDSPLGASEDSWAAGPPAAAGIAAAALLVRLLVTMTITGPASREAP